MRRHKPGLRLDQPPQPRLSRSLSLQGHLHRRHLLHYRRAVGHGQRVHLVQPQHWRPGNNQGAALSPSSTEPHPHSCAARPAPSQSPVWPSFTLFESPCLASSPGSFVALLSQAPPTPGTHSFGPAPGSSPAPWLPGRSAAGVWCSTVLASCWSWVPLANSRPSSLRSLTLSWGACSAPYLVSAARERRVSALSQSSGARPARAAPPAVSCALRHDYRRGAVQSAVRGHELLPQPLRARIFHVLRAHAAKLPGVQPRRHQHRCPQLSDCH